MATVPQNNDPSVAKGLIHFEIFVLEQMQVLYSRNSLSLWVGSFSIVEGHHFYI